jgi:hypothetical protein
VFVAGVDSPFLWLFDVPDFGAVLLELLPSALPGFVILLDADLPILPIEGIVDRRSAPK